MVVLQKQPLDMFCKKGALRTFVKFTEKHLCQSIFFNNEISFLLKKRPLYRRFALNFAKFLRPPFWIKYFRWLLLVLSPLDWHLTKLRWVFSSKRNKSIWSGTENDLNLITIITLDTLKSSSCTLYARYGPEPEIESLSRLCK